MSDNGSPLMGEIVTWDTAGARPVGVDLVRQALKTASLPEDEAGDLQARSVFSRACKDLKDGRLIRKVETNGRKVTFQLTGEVLNQNKLDYNYECQIVLDVDSGAIECPENTGVEDLARKLFADATIERNSRDITAIVQRLFKKHAELFACNPRKGVCYFVPQIHEEFTAKVESFLRAMGGVLWRFPVPRGTEQGDFAVQDALKHGFEERLAELQEAVNGWGESTKKGTMEKMKAKFDVAAFKIDAYRELLKDQAAALDQLVEVGKQQVLDKLLAAGGDEA